MPSIFFRLLQLITDLLLIFDSYMTWSRLFFSLKRWVGFSIFDSVLFLVKFSFHSTKSMDSLILKRDNLFQN